MKSDPEYGLFGVGDKVKIISGQHKNKVGEIYSAWSPEGQITKGNIFYEELDVYAPWWVMIGSIIELCTNSQLKLLEKFADQPHGKPIVERNMAEYKAKRFVV